MNEKDLRDAFAMFAMLRMGFDINNGYERGAEQCWKIADAMLATRDKEPEQEVGIVAAKTRRKKND